MSRVIPAPRLSAETVYKGLAFFGTRHLAEYWSSVFALGFGLVLLMTGDERLSMGLFQGNKFNGFEKYALMYSLTVTFAGAIGLYGVAKKLRAWRTTSSLILFAGLGWLSVYYYFAIPVPWQAVWMYVAHSLLEGVIFLRVKHGLDSGWH